jgi:hypothetical protein
MSIDGHIEATELRSTSATATRSCSTRIKSALIGKLITCFATALAIGVQSESTGAHRRIAHSELE